MSQATTTEGLIAPDFSGVKDRVGEGDYKVRIVDSKVDQWAGKDGNPPTTFINWTMETFGEADAKNNGRRIFHRTPIEGKGAFRLQDFFRAATGIDCPPSFDRTQLHGSELEVTYGPQKDRPEYSEVKSVRPMKH